jgi:hypothetical protein
MAVVSKDFDEKIKNAEVGFKFVEGGITYRKGPDFWEVSKKRNGLVHKEYYGKSDVEELLKTILKNGFAMSLGMPTKVRYYD